MLLSAILQATALDRADAEVLLAAILNKDRSWIISHPEKELTSQESEQWKNWESRRKNHEPVAYITGRKEFFGREFIVTKDVLIPRPATEGLVSIAIDLCKKEKLAIEEKTFPLDSEIVGWLKIWKEDRVSTIVDIGTGSGCIAVTLARELPHLKIIATDISEATLEIARQNAVKHHVTDRIDFRHGSLLDPISDVKEPFFILSNPPYIPDGTELEKDVTDFEPQKALFAGKSGTEIVHEIDRQACEHPMCGGFLIECLQAK